MEELVSLYKESSMRKERDEIRPLILRILKLLREYVFYILSNALPKVVKICVFSYFSLVSLAGAKGYSLSLRGGSIRMIQI